MSLSADAAAIFQRLGVPAEPGFPNPGVVETKILREEMARLKCRNPLSSFGISMLGPALLKYGTEEQKLEHFRELGSSGVKADFDGRRQVLKLEPVGGIEKPHGESGR